MGSMKDVEEEREATSLGHAPVVVGFALSADRLRPTREEATRKDAGDGQDHSAVWFDTEGEEAANFY